MWTATLHQVDKEQRTAVVLFTDSAKYKFLDTIDLKGHTSKSFRDNVEGRRLQYESLYSFVDSIDPKTFSLTPDSATPLTQAELAKQQFYKDLGQLNLLKQFKDPADKELSDLQTKLNANYKAEYFA
jgi:hypothetical protein